MSEQFEPHAEMSPELVLSEAETRRLVEQIEARIKATEKLERAIATRPQPSDEPVAVWREAWQAAKVNGAWSSNDNGLVLDLSEEAAAAVIASALEAARREGELVGLEKAAEIADSLHYPDKTKISASIRDAIRGLGLKLGIAIRALKENANG